MKKENYSKLFLILCSINISCLLISNVIAIKTISIFGILLTAADVMFPITYILNDVFTEVYGYKKARDVIWISFACNLIAVILFQIAIVLPVDETFLLQNDLINIIGSTPRILFASFVSFLVGNFANSIVMSKIKVKTKGKYLGLRTILSTLIGEGLDTIFFVPIVFIGTLEIQEILILMLNMYIFKVAIEVVFTPITYKVVKFIKKKENVDVYDEKIKYKIFK